MAKTYLTAKQKRFIDEYIKCGSGAKAARAAGYNCKNAAQIGQCNLAKPSIRDAINERLKEIEDASIADAKEIMKYLTSVMRGESQSSEIVIEGNGPGLSLAREVNKAPSEADRLKAASLLAKRFGLTTTEAEEKIKLDYLKLENEKLKAEIEKIKGGAEEEISDGFMAALNSSAVKDWSDG